MSKTYDNSNTGAAYYPRKDDKSLDEVAIEKNIWSGHYQITEESDSKRRLILKLNDMKLFVMNQKGTEVIARALVEPTGKDVPMYHTEIKGHKLSIFKKKYGEKDLTYYQIVPRKDYDLGEVPDYDKLV